MNEYSKEWDDFLKVAIIYQEKLKLFFNLEETHRLKDLKKSLLDSNITYYALKVVENSSNDFIYKLLEELIHVVIYGNVSNSHLAKKIILGINKTEIRKDVYSIILKYYQKEKKDAYIINDIALFLYDLRYKKELVEFVEKNLSALRETEFIDSEEDMEDIYNMEDFN